MHDILKLIPPEWIAIACFLAGQWWSDRRVFQSRRDQGQRLGVVEDKVAHVEGAHELAQKIVDLLTARGASRTDG